MHGGIKISQDQVMNYMRQVVIATKKQIIEEAGINPNSKAIAKCVQHKELYVLEIPLMGFVTYRYYIFSEFKL